MTQKLSTRVYYIPTPAKQALWNVIWGILLLTIWYVSQLPQEQNDSKDFVLKS